MISRKGLLTLVLLFVSPQIHSLPSLNDLCSGWWTKTCPSEISKAVSLMKYCGGAGNWFYNKLVKYRKNKSDMYVSVDHKVSLRELNRICVRQAHLLEQKYNIKNPVIGRIKTVSEKDDRLFIRNGSYIPSDASIEKKVTISGGNRRIIIQALLKESDSRRERMDAMKKKA